jgi:hypothetical protein
MGVIIPDKDYLIRENGLRYIHLPVLNKNVNKIGKKVA